MTNTAVITNTSGNQNHVGSQIGQEEISQTTEETCKSEGTQAGGTLQQNNISTTKSTGTGTRTKDYNDEIVSENISYCLEILAFNNNNHILRHEISMKCITI